MTNERFLELQDEIKHLQDLDKQTSDRVQHELNVMDEKQPILIEKATTEYIKVQPTDLPIYKMYKGYKCVWYYKFEIIDNRQVCLLLKDDEIHGMSIQPVMPHNILNKENEDCKEYAWILTTAKFLNWITHKNKDNE